MAEMQSLAEGFASTRRQLVPHLEQPVLGFVVEVLGLQMIQLAVDGRRIGQLILDGGANPRLGFDLVAVAELMANLAVAQVTMELWATIRDVAEARRRDAAWDVDEFELTTTNGGSLRRLAEFWRGTAYEDHPARR